MTINKYFKEKEYAEELLKKRKVSAAIKSDLKILAKYFKYQGMSYKEIEEKLYHFCEVKCKQWFNKVLHYSYIDSAVNFSKKKENVLVQIESIEVTKPEIEYIKSLNYEKIEKKILFGLLVHNKLKQEKARLRGLEVDITKNFFGGNGEYSYKNLLESLNEKFTRTFKEKEIHKIIKKFNDSGLTRTTQKTALELLFVQNIKESDEVVLKINDFDSIGLYFSYYLGDEKVKVCEECHENLIKVTNNNSKYCKACLKEKQKMWQRESMKRLRDEM